MGESATSIKIQVQDMKSESDLGRVCVSEAPLLSSKISETVRSYGSEPRSPRKERSESLAFLWSSSSGSGRREPALESSKRKPLSPEPETKSPSSSEGFGLHTRGETLPSFSRLRNLTASSQLLAQATSRSDVNVL